MTGPCSVERKRERDDIQEEEEREQTGEMGIHK